MEQLLQSQKMTVTKSVLDATEEYVISGDYILPEYCPDVAVVLKCVVTPRLQSRRWSGDTFMVDGMAVVRVLYLDEERCCVREAEFTQPINCALRGQSGCEAVPVQVRMTQDYVNCRAVSPRRIEVRGGFTVRARADQADEMELPCASAEDRLYTKCISKTVTAPLSSGEKMISVNETLAFDSGLPAAEQLLGGDCSAAVTEVKLLTDKAIVKGQIYLHQLYTDDSVNGTTYVLDYTVPFSAIMDMDGVRDGQMHAACVSVLTDTEECLAGANGQNTVLGFSAKLLIQLTAYEKAVVQLMKDAYHPDCPAVLNNDTVSLHTMIDAFCQTSTVQKSVALPADNLREIIDVWVTPMTPVGRVENECVELDLPMMVSLLARDNDGIIVYYERAEDCRITHTQAFTCTDENAVSVQSQASVMGLSYAAVGDKLDLHLTLAVSTELWENSHEQVVREIALQKENAYPVDGTAMRLYYADEGESVWDIARRCHTSPDAVRAENELRDEILSAKIVLLIPQT